MMRGQGIYLDWGVRIGRAGGEGAVLSMEVEGGQCGGGELRLKGS